MFSTLGLLQSGECPDREQCTRVRCFFSHNDRPTVTRKPGKGKDRAAPVAVPQKRPAEPQSPLFLYDSPGQSPAQRRVTDSTAVSVTPPTPPVVPKPRPEVQRKVAEVVKPTMRPPPPPLATSRVSPMPAKTPPLAPVAGPSTLVPILSKSAKTSQPWSDRQKGLRTLHTQFEKLYSSIPKVSPDLAKKSATEQESEISTTSGNIASYKRAIHHAAVQISRRAKPDSTNHPSVGTMKESRAATDKADKEIASKLTKDRIERYLLPVADFEKWRYPNPNDSSLVDPEIAEPDAEGTAQTCSRCKKDFVVSSKNLKERSGECHFHHGRVAPERIEGRRKWIYTCCKRERGEAGCEEGVHVFSHGDDDKMLAKRVPYERIEPDPTGTHVGVEVLGMDCEMIYTTAGLSLARLTVVDETGAAVLDEIVRQHVPVLDVNARFSGITHDQLDKAVMDIRGVRAAARMFIGSDTILVGHGLENDLRALRILHDRIIDTAVLFPHDKGHPFRRALRDIVKEKLGVFIQDRTADLGHSSAEDAKAALDLVKWQVRDDKDD